MIHTFFQSNARWADKLRSVGIDGIERDFDHPFVQACSMFLGEMLCLFTFKLFYYMYRRRGVSAG